MSKVTKFIRDLFLDHPKSIGESYFTHMLQAIKMASLSLLVCTIFLIHSIFPFLFEKLGCDIVRYISEKCERGASYDKNIKDIEG